jgi:16S rRNA (uracil1498-N3)-methyltransferase
VIRVFSPEPLAPDRLRIALAPEERHHLDVRRAPADQPVEVLDGEGGVGRGVSRGRGDERWVELSAVIRVPRPPDLVLLVGAGDRQRFGWLVEKLQELGATRLVPVVTERSRDVATGLTPAQVSRLSRRAVEAMKQGGVPWRLAIAPPGPLAAALEAVSADVRWLADPAGSAPGPIGPADAVAILVGPEGGFTDRERGLAAGRGFSPVSLGGGVLRFETAAVAAAAVIATFRGRPS